MPPLTFRTQALEKLVSPEQLDQLIRITTLKNWLALVSLACVMLPLFAWGLWGSLETRISANGLLLPSGGLCVASASQSGRVTNLYVQAGQEVQSGQRVVSFQPGSIDNQPEEITSPCNGKVVGIMARPGDWVDEVLTLITIEPAGKVLEGVAFITIAEARSLTPGLAALISPAGIQSEVNGYLIGTVTSIGQYPIDQQILARQVGSQSLAQTILQNGAFVEVHILLANNQEGYQWSLKRQPNQALTSGTPCSISILVQRQTPFELIFPSYSH
jgi:hypothetical protein